MREVQSGVYAIAKIISKVIIQKDKPVDYCNNRSTVEAEILEISYVVPIISIDKCKIIFRQFRSTHRIKDDEKIEQINLILSYLDSIKPLT